MTEIFTWELVGIIVTFITGSFLHFLYPLSGNLYLVGIISAVNESTWEHLKLAFWPMFIFSIIEYIHLGQYLSTFWQAKAINIIITMILITVIYYTYKAIIGKNYLVLDIGLFFFGIVCGHLSSYFLMINNHILISDTLGVIIMIILFLCFTIFTFVTPKYELFRDPTNGKYGIS